MREIFDYKVLDLGSRGDQKFGFYQVSSLGTPSSRLDYLCAGNIDEIGPAVSAIAARVAGMHTTEDVGLVPVSVYENGCSLCANPSNLDLALIQQIAQLNHNYIPAFSTSRGKNIYIPLSLLMVGFVSDTKAIVEAMNRLNGNAQRVKGAAIGLLRIEPNKRPSIPVYANRIC